MATLKRVTKGVVEFLAFGSVIYMFVVVKPEVEGLREDFDALDRTISKVEEEMIQGNCTPMERQVEARDGVPTFSVPQRTQSSGISSILTLFFFYYYRLYNLCYKLCKFQELYS